MSIDLNWETLTQGEDGEALAASIRDFVHTKFQAVPLPRFIRSVTVHGFDFGTVPPDLVLKDISDPLPDFYEEELEDDEEDDDDDEDGNAERPGSYYSGGGPGGMGERRRTEMRRDAPSDMGSPLLGVSTPGILGSAAGNVHYFPGHFGMGMGVGGTQTPLDVVAGAQVSGQQRDERFFPQGVQGDVPSSRHSRQPSDVSVDREFEHGVGGGRGGSTPVSAGHSRPSTRDQGRGGESAVVEEEEEEEGGGGEGAQRGRRLREPRPEDMQAVFRIRYAGDVRLNLTAEILIDYPMPSFVGIPLRLSITGVTFDGVGVVAWIRKRVHFCFLSPEDAVTAVGLDEEEDGDGDGEALGGRRRSSKGEGGSGKVFGGLLQEIRVESEIGQREGNKQSLKNVGKVERFVLEQVRRIFEDEFVYPSFWTFLV